MPIATRMAQAACGKVLRGARCWWVVAQPVGAGVVVCPLVCVPRHHHRADICIGWVQALQLGCPAQAVLRCRPVWRANVAGLHGVGWLNSPLRQRMLTTLVQELRRHRDETGRPFATTTRRPDTRCSRFFDNPHSGGAHATQDTSTRAGRIRAISFGAAATPQAAQYTGRNAAGYLYPHHAGG
ncbi:hypothetical protein CSR02_06060 [Acetobacter pomorum]|uniref:Uncharacterized protein n=1 Tax=Acetobacter pomorum TaxID=65959 RepID=A0A2G4RCC5_9PROT|nr:hypothetical protein [Acetobacter pomorum]PHY94223.1 hypothetical protein CSR02_06060 [Acetobacter pomorum]GBR49030.1 hypothetical protein AA11825_1210 [Acetobacter pomorum DSM 11825]